MESLRKRMFRRRWDGFVSVKQFSIKTELIYNPGHNILELYNTLVQIRFTTNKRKLDI